MKKQKASQGMIDNEKGVLIKLFQYHKKYRQVWERKFEIVETELDFPDPYILRRTHYGIQQGRKIGMDDDFHS